MSARVAYLFGGDGADAIRPCAHVIDAEPDGDGGAVPARQGGLAVLRIDRLGDHLRLDALEVFGGHRIGREFRDHFVDGLLDLREFNAGFGEAETPNWLGSIAVPWYQAPALTASGLSITSAR